MLPWDAHTVHKLVQSGAYNCAKRGAIDARRCTMACLVDAAWWCTSRAQPMHNGAQSFTW
eukprot:scaffold152327_cov27-Tisochrysis_lutea.AAC.1